MATDTHLQRIDQLVAVGKLTDDEAARLRESMHTQAERDAPLREAAAARPQARRRLVPLLALLAIVFALGALTVWLYSSSAPPALGNRAQRSAGRARPGPAHRSPKTRRGEEYHHEPFTSHVIRAHTAVPSWSCWAVCWLFFYNGLVSAREQVNAGWAQVENVYQRRLDLVPVLVDAVQTYTEHERETLTELTAARANALQLSGAVSGSAPETAEQVKAIEASQGRVESALARLFAVVENYPDLKASSNFLGLQDQLEGTENRVAMERRSYNEFSRRYNTRLQTFPSNLVASMMGFESKPYFQAEETALKPSEDPFGRRDS